MKKHTLIDTVEWKTPKENVDFIVINEDDIYKKLIETYLHSYFHKSETKDGKYGQRCLAMKVEADFKLESLSSVESFLLKMKIEDLKKYFKIEKRETQDEYIYSIQYTYE